MAQAKGFALRLYRHSFVRYAVIGGSTFALDFGLLALLHDIAGLHVIFAATVSYWISIAFNFVANRAWTFGSTNQQLTQHLTAYLLLLGINYLFTIAVVGVATHFGVHYAIAKIVAVAIQIGWTYVIYKKFIFV